jgi:hypothetical protein
MDDSTVLTDRQGVEEFTYLLLCRRLCFFFCSLQNDAAALPGLRCYGSNRSTLLRDLVSFFFFFEYIYVVNTNLFRDGFGLLCCCQL